MQYTFMVPHRIIVLALITIEADTYEQAEADMLKAALDQGLDLTPDWQLIERD